MKRPDFLDRHRPFDDEEQPWLFTYADMITLLMCFFVVLLSMSTLNMAKVEMMTEHFAKPDRMSLRQLEKMIREFIEQEKLQHEINVELTLRGVEVSFKDKLLFDIGKADLKIGAKHILSKISGLFAYGDITRRRITIEGHTDSIPIKSDMYPSNWELSSARAANVVNFFIKRNLDSKRFESIGYADTQPVVPETYDNRGLAANRRVVVVVTPDSYLGKTPRRQVRFDDYKEQITQ